MNRNVTDHRLRLVSLVIAAAIMSGCAGSGFKLSDAALSGNPDAMWEEGQQAVTTGEASVSKGEKRLAAGRKLVRDGEAMIAAGNQRVLQAKNDYIAAATSGGDSTTPKQVEEEAKRMRTIGKRWEDAIDEIREGNKLVERGNKSINQGQTEVREGRVLMEQGSTLMRNPQRAHRGQKLLPQPVMDTR